MQTKRRKRIRWYLVEGGGIQHLQIKLKFWHYTTKKFTAQPLSALPSTTKWALNFSKLKPCVRSLNKRIELNKIHLYFTMFQKFRWTVKFRGKTRPFNVLEWIKVLFSIPSICNFKNKRFFSAGNSTHVNYGQRGNWNLMEGLYIAVCNNCFVFNTSIPKPSPSTVFWVGLVLYSLIRCFTLEQWH